MNEMKAEINPDQLLSTIGNHIFNTQTEYLGDVVDITHDKDGKNCEYLIIKSSEFFGPGSRYFAIAVFPFLISISLGGNVIFKANKDDLQFARGIAADKCPKPNLKTGQNIYEIYNYKGAEEASH